MRLSAVLIAVVSAGCSLPPVSLGTHIRYQPAAATSTAASVALRVTDARREGSGARVGRLQSYVSGPLVVDDQRADVVPATVVAATTEALQRAGVGVGAGGKTLEASVLRYWVTGISGYSEAGPINTNFDATIEVGYRLLDGSGQPLWTGEVTVRTNDEAQFKGPQTMTEDTVARALALLARRAGAQFAAAPFQRALAN